MVPTFVRQQNKTAERKYILKYLNVILREPIRTRMTRKGRIIHNWEIIFKNPTLFELKTIDEKNEKAK